MQENIIKDVRNLFRLNKLEKETNYVTIKSIRNLFRQKTKIEQFLECKEDILKMLYRVPDVKTIIQLRSNKNHLSIMVKVLKLKNVSLLKKLV